MTYEEMQVYLKGLRKAEDYNGLFYSVTKDNKLLSADEVVEEMSWLESAPIIVTGDNRERFNAVSFLLQSSYRQGMREVKQYDK